MLEVTNPEKRAKSSPGRDLEMEGTTHDLSCIDPLDSSAHREPRLRMSPAVRLECFHPLETSEEVHGVTEEQKDATCSDMTCPGPTAEPQGLAKKTKSRPSKKSGVLAKETDPTEAVPSSKTKRPRPNPPSSEVLSTKFGSVLHPRGQAEWDQLCSATDMETGQLKGNIGAPNDPLFTYEDAVHRRGTEQDLLLCVGHDIIPAEEDEFPKKKSEGVLKTLRKQAIEAQLPELPKGVLPGGWDAFGRPWALIDCPAEKVPRIPSAHGKLRVTVAALVSFPPEPFYLVNLVHLDGVIRVSNKVSHVTHRGLQGELNVDQTLKEAHKTYSRLKLPGYRDSVPVQECLKEPRWSAFREGRWGRQTNPPAPVSDVRPGAVANIPIGERLVAPTASVPLDDESSSDSGSLSRPTSSSSDSSPGPRQPVRRLASRVLSSDPEEVSNDMDEGVDATPALEFPALCTPSDAILTEAVTTSVFHRSQVETNEAAASEASPVIVRTSRARDQLSHAQRGGISPRTGPCRARARTSDDQSLSSRPVTPVASSRVDWTPGQSLFDWAPIETDSWEKFEDAAWRATQGAAKKAIDYAVDVMALLRTDLNDRMERRTETLRAAQDSEEFRQSGQVENLMGRVCYLWEGNAEFKKKIATFEACYGCIIYIDRLPLLNFGVILVLR